MAVKTPEQTKIVLLLQPECLLRRHTVVQLLAVRRQKQGISMTEMPISLQNIQAVLNHWPADAKRCLLRLSLPAIDEQLEKLVVQFKHQARQTDIKLFQDKEMAFYYQQQLGLLKQLTGDITWYHRLFNNTMQKAITAPCTYHPFTVLATFQLVQQNHLVVLNSWIQMGNNRFPIDQYKRFHFLLEHNHTYLHLNLKSYQALEWLALHQHVSWLLEDTQRTDVVVNYLKSNGLAVDYEDLLQKKTMEVLPQKRVLLSELNNTFLMLTPQFVYNGIVVEGPFTSKVEAVYEGEPVLISRHVETEQGLTNWLKNQHPNFLHQPNGFFYLSFAEAQKKSWFLKVYHNLLQLDVDLIGMDLLKHFRYSTFQATTEVELTETIGDWISLHFRLSFGVEIVPLAELQKMLLNGQKAVLLKDGSLGVLGEDWLQQYGQLLKHGKVHKNQLHVPRWLAMSYDGPGENGGSTIDLIRPSIPPDWWKRWKQWQQDPTPIYTLPPQLNLPALRPYQQKGYEWMRLLSEAGGSACLADDMGLGKTLQTICFLLHRLAQNAQSKHLVVCPASLMYNWQQEFAKFAPSTVCCIHHGAGRTEENLYAAENQVIITSYGTLRQDVDLFAGIKFDTAVLDESHHIKNAAALVTKAVGQIVAQIRIALSGTPVMNGTADLHAQFNFLLPGFLGSRQFFNQEYAIPIEQQGDKEKAAALQKLINPFILRRTKQQAAPELPAKTESILWCQMGHDQRQAYETVKENIKNNVMLDIAENGLNKGKMSILVGLMKLRQLCNSAELVTDQDLFCSDSIKTEILIDELKNIVPQHKALIFSQFTSMLDLLEKALQKAGIAYLRLDGKTKVADRQHLVNNFQRNETNTPVFLLSLKAGNVGLNLTAADYVFLFDPWWNTAVENQAIDRTHRIGQQSQVFAYRLICKNTIEERIINLAARKKVIAEDLITAEESFVKSLTLEDVAYLLE